MNAKPKTELNRYVFVQKRYSVNGALGRRRRFVKIMQGKKDFPFPGNTRILNTFFYRKIITTLTFMKKM